VIPKVVHFDVDPASLQALGWSKSTKRITYGLGDKPAHADYAVLEARRLAPAPLPLGFSNHRWWQTQVVWVSLWGNRGARASLEIGSRSTELKLGEDGDETRVLRSLTLKLLPSDKEAAAGEAQLIVVRSTEASEANVISAKKAEDFAPSGIKYRFEFAENWASALFVALFWVALGSLGVVIAAFGIESEATWLKALVGACISIITGIGLQFAPKYNLGKLLHKLFLWLRASVWLSGPAAAVTTALVVLASSVIMDYYNRDRYQAALTASLSKSQLDDPLPLLKKAFCLFPNRREARFAITRLIRPMRSLDIEKFRDAAASFVDDPQVAGCAKALLPNMRATPATDNEAFIWYLGLVLDAEKDGSIDRRNQVLGEIGSPLPRGPLTEVIRLSIELELAAPAQYRKLLAEMQGHIDATLKAGTKHGWIARQHLFHEAIDKMAQAKIELGPDDAASVKDAMGDFATILRLRRDNQNSAKTGWERPPVKLGLYHYALARTYGPGDEPDHAFTKDILPYLARPATKAGIETLARNNKDWFPDRPDEVRKVWNTGILELMKDDEFDTYIREEIKKW
jgi:hypothetical protein